MGWISMVLMEILMKLWEGIVQWWLFLEFKTSN
jgi:hypothetical protein